ncbi:MAG: GspH/FimT family pseudopilin [Pseudomonadota bacterium]
MKKSHGFSLIELMMVLVVAAILLGIAIPSFTEIIKNNRLTSQTNSLLTSFSLARAEAITRRTTVAVCTPQAGANSCQASTAWQDGWVVFVDEGKDGNWADDELLQQSGPLEGGNTLSAGRNVVRFGSDGLATGYNGTWLICDDRGIGDAHALILSNTGRARVAQDSEIAGLTCP